MLKVKFDWNTSKFQKAIESEPHEASHEQHGQGMASGSVNGGPRGFSGSIGLDDEASSIRSGGASFGGVGSAFSATNQASNNQICCLTEETVRCSRGAGNASYSKRIQKTVQQKRLRLSIDTTARHIYICDHHKSKWTRTVFSIDSNSNCGPFADMIQSVRTSTKRKRKDSENDDNSNDGYGYAVYENSRDSTIGEGPQVDLGTLHVNALKRYKKHYRIQTRPGSNKSHLVEVDTKCSLNMPSNTLRLISQSLMRHFRTMPVIEKEAITYFVYMVKTNRNKLDQSKGAFNDS